MKTCWYCGERFDEETFYTQCGDCYDQVVLDMSSDEGRDLSRIFSKLTNHPWVDDELKALADSHIGPWIVLEILQRMDHNQRMNLRKQLANRL